MYGTPKFLEFVVTSKPNALILMSEIFHVNAGNANTKLEFHLNSGKVITATTAADANLLAVTACNAAIKAALVWDAAKKGPKATELVTLGVACSAVAVA